jgi:DnaJ-class molecular chaperone
MTKPCNKCRGTGNSATPNYPRKCSRCLGTGKMNRTRGEKKAVAK